MTSAVLADFDRVIELDPTDGWAWAARGRARADGDDLEGALADLTRASDLRPEDALAWTDLGRISVDLGDASGAIQAISRAIDLGGDNAYTYALRAKARWLAADFEHLMDRMSQDPPTLHHLMALAVGGAAVNQAMEDLQQAFELDTEVAASVFGVGRGDDLRRLMDTIRLLTDQQPDDLEGVLTAVSRAMQSADATERLAELLTLESVLEVRASTAVEGPTSPMRPRSRQAGGRDRDQPAGVGHRRGHHKRARGHRPHRLPRAVATPSRDRQRPESPRTEQDSRRRGRQPSPGWRSRVREPGWCPFDEPRVCRWRECCVNSLHRRPGNGYACAAQDVGLTAAFRP